MIHNRNWHAKGQETDFRDKSQYTYISKLGNVEIAWELLRRSSEYRDDYDAFLYALDTGDERFPVIHRAMCHRFGITRNIGIMNPYLRWPPNFGVSASPKGTFVLKIWHAPGFWIEKSDPTDPCFDVRFYLDQPFDEQVENYRKRYNKIRKAMGFDDALRRNIGSYITYCRILDALRENYTVQEIADLLYPNDTKATRLADRVRLQIKRAQYMATEGYLELATAPSGNAFKKKF